MKVFHAVVVTLSLSIFTPAFAQQPQAASPKNIDNQKDSLPPHKQGEVVRIGVTLVQLDVTVTDSKGRPVTDLKAEDFEVLQNAHPQHITNFSYVVAQPQRGEPAAAPVKGKNLPLEPPPPPPRLKPSQVRRAIALVADDLTLSFNSTALVRAALKKFVDEQMQPGDLVGIIRTGAGMGALQQFTNDKSQLYAAIDRVRWKPGYGSINTFAPVTTDPPRDLVGSAASSRLGVDTQDVTGTFGYKSPLSGSFGAKGPDTDTPETFRQEVFAIGTLGALGYVVRGLSNLPGRKSVVLFSDSLRIYNREQNVLRVQQALDNLTDMANRASVSFYTIDARGLEVLGMNAADDLSGDLERIDSPLDRTNYLISLRKTWTAMTDRSREFVESQQGLAYLADRTGGLFTKNSNDLSRGVRQALQDQAGYYLIGFVPDQSTFKSKNGGRVFHEIAVKAKRAGLRVRARTGFYGFAEEESLPLRTSAARELLAAVGSPFNTGELRVQMTCQFFQDPKGGAFINALLHIDARDLTFEETVNGWRKAAFEVAAFTFGDNGRPIDQSDRIYSVNMSDEDYERTLKTGIFYRVNLPIKKPGAYQLRTAVRDHTSRKLGSANQFIEVPDAKQGRLTLSGLIVGAADSSPEQPAGHPTDNREGRVGEADAQARPAARRFKPGAILDYAYVIYGAKPDKATGGPQLLTRLRLYRDGKLVYDGEPRPFNPESQTNFKQLIAGGSLRLASDLPPGEYALQVIAVDKLAKEKERLAAGWIDFEIVR
jgi:VWFA-related protein